MHFRVLGSLAVLSLFTGCASTWSEQQKAGLATISVSLPTVAANAPHPPDAKDSPGMADSLTRATGGGLIPSLIGSAIDASVTAKQQRKYDAANSSYFEDLAEAVGAPPVTQIQGGLQEMLGSHSFFGPRLKENGRAALSTEILRYGLQISPVTPKDGPVLLRLRITAKVSLKNADGTVLWSQVFNGVAFTPKKAQDILTDADFIPLNITEAIKDLRIQILTAIDPKLGLKPHEDYSHMAGQYGLR